MIKDKIKENVNMTVPLYLMMSYAYYKQDNPIAEDATFDKVAKILLKKKLIILEFFQLGQDINYLVILENKFFN